MQKSIINSYSFPLKITLMLFFLVALVLFFTSRDKTKVADYNSYDFYTGNVGIGESAPIPTPTPLPDTEAPLVNVTNPLNSSLVSGLVEMKAEASDSAGIASTSFFVDGNYMGTDTSVPYSSLWDTTVYAHNSVHTIIVSALDLAGNEASSSAVTVTVLDVTAPQGKITYPVNSSIVSKNSNITITAIASDVSGINKVEFYVNGVLKCSDFTNQYSCAWKVPPRKNVVYNLQAKAFDSAGNIQVDTITVTSR